MGLSKVFDLSQTLSKFRILENPATLTEPWDVKFSMNEGELGEFMTDLERLYFVLDHNGIQIDQQQLIYFDTPKKRFFNEHHQNKPNRCKVMLRSGLNSLTRNFELNQRNARGEVSKHKIRMEGGEVGIPIRFFEEFGGLLKENEELEESLRGSYRRVVLVFPKTSEQVCIDFDVSFSRDGEIEEFKDLVMIQIKQKRVDHQSPAMLKLRKMNKHVFGISKYCLGVSVLYPELKSNGFKNKITRIKNIISN